MNLSTISSTSILKLLALAERKEELLKLVGELDAAMLEVINNDISITAGKVVGFEVVSEVAIGKTKVDKAPKKAKRKLSAASRAKMAASAKARWAERKAAKSPESAEPAKPAEPVKKVKKPKKAFRIPKPE